MRASERAESRLREMRTRLGYWIEIRDNLMSSNVSDMKNSGDFRVFGSNQRLGWY